MAGPGREEQDAVGQSERLAQIMRQADDAARCRLPFVTSHSRSAAAVGASSETNGSSSSNRSGRLRQARANETRRCIPPDSLPGKLVREMLPGRTARSNASIRPLRPRGGVGDQKQIRAHAEPWHQPRGLEHDAEPGCGGAAECDPSRKIRIQSGEDMQQRRLAAAGRVPGCTRTPPVARSSRTSLSTVRLRPVAGHAVVLPLDHRIEKAHARQPANRRSSGRSTKAPPAARRCR